MNCYICGEKSWIELKDFHKESVLLICKPCGNLCHRVEEQDEKVLLDFYRKEYRKAPNHINLITTGNKMLYHEAFLKDFLEGKKGLSCADIGAATGYFLAWLKKLGHRVTGTEYTTTFRRVSEHFYGIPLTEELQSDRSYDLISIYHTLEHLSKPDEKIKRYLEVLKDDGRIYIACPYWLEEIWEPSGTPISTFENWFHKNHINLFSRNQLKNIFRKLGLYWEKENYTYYGQTYLLRRGEKKTIEQEDWQRVLDILTKVKTAIEFYSKGKFKQATEIYPDFPDAHTRLILGTYSKEPERQIDAWESLPEKIKQNFHIRSSKMGWLIQRQEFEKALVLGEEILKDKPNCDTLNNIALCLTRLGRYKEAMSIFSVIASRNPTVWTSSTDLTLWCAAQMPSWDERAMDQAKDMLFKEALNTGKIKVELKDETSEVNSEGLSSKEIPMGGVVSGISDGTHGNGPDGIYPKQGIETVRDSAS